MMRLYIEEIDAVSAGRLDEVIRELPAWRREKTLSYRREQGRKECAMSYMLLCRALREVYGIESQPAFFIGEHGKPALSLPKEACHSPLPHFNISHCRKAVACVVSDEEVGVDIERVGRLSDAVARHVLNDEEYASVMAADNPDEEFTVYWTKKEAIVKLTGRGIDDDLKNILVKYKHVRLHTERHPDKGYVVTVARF